MRLARLPQRPEDVRDVVAAEIADERPDAARVSQEQPLQPAPCLRLEALEQRPADGLLVGAEERLVLLIRHLVDATAQLIAALERVRRPQPTSVLELDHLPAVRPELRLQLRRPDPGDDAIERLPVEVDDPEHVAELPCQRVGQRFPDVPLVQLRVAEQRDEAASGGGAEPALRNRSASAPKSGAAEPSPTDPVE